MTLSSLCPLVLLFVLLTPSGPARACSCLPPPAPKVALEDADAVFVGTVTKVEAVDEGSVKVSFTVTKIWKGIEKQEMVLTTASNSAACGVHFEAETSYLVYAYKTQTGWETNLCTRTTPLASADADLKALGEGNAPKL